MAKTIWALDFGDWALKLARGTYEKKTDTITVELVDTIVYGSLPCGYDAGPQEKHREGIIAFRERYEIASGDDLCVSVTGSEVFSRFINLPPVPESIGEIIRYEARQQIPFDIEEVVWDYQPVKEQHEPGEEIEVGLFALKTGRVEELMDLLEPWRGNLRIVQNAPLAVYNLLAYEGQVDQPAVVVDIGASTTDVLVLNPPRFWVRTLLVAGDDLTNALVEQFGVELEEAEKIKRRAGQSRHKEQIMRILQPVFEDITSELQRSLGYYKSLAPDARFDRVLALGNGLKMTGLNQILAGGLQYSVEPFGGLSRMEVADSVDRDRLEAGLPGLSAALGLIVQGAGQGKVNINMVPEEVAIASQIATKKPWLLAASVALLLAVAALTVGEIAYATDVEEAEKDLPFGILERANSIQQKYNQQAKKTKQIKQKLQSWAAGGVDRELFLELLPLYAARMPKDVYTSRLVFSWMPPGKIKQGTEEIAARGGSAGGGAGSITGPGAGAQAGAQRGLAAMEAAMQRVQAAKASIARGRRGKRRTEEAAPAEGGGPSPGAGPAGKGQKARAKADTKLVMTFSCETTHTSRKWIRENVFEQLRGSTFPGAQKSVFDEVEMIGDVRDVYLDPATRQQVNKDTPGAERNFIFSGYAVVNTGSGKGK